MKLGIDVDSGERPFSELVEAVLSASQRYPEDYFYIIGDLNRIQSCFARINRYTNVVLVHAPLVISMGEQPLQAIRRKKQSTVNVGINLLKQKQIDAFFSPGNTGATVVAAQISLGLINGVKRPALGTFIPRISNGETLILDVGANPELKEEFLYHNALMGKSFYQSFYLNEQAKIGLLSIGTEVGKGNSIIKKAQHLLKDLDGFVGNIEPYNLIDGSVDIAVTDGFTGNTILKSIETIKKLFTYKLKSFIDYKTHDSLIGKVLYTPLKKIVNTQKKSDFFNSFLPPYYGAAPLFGVKGSVFVGHGATSGDDLINAIETMKDFEEKKVNEKMIVFFKKNK